MNGIRHLLAVLAVVVGATSLAAQNDVAAPCDRIAQTETLQTRCLQAAQAVVSAQPQLGILLAGGNPTLGTASTSGGFRLGLFPKATLTGRVGVVFVDLPDLLAEQVAGGGNAGRVVQTLGVPAPAVSATATVGVFDGVNLAPLVGGIGSVDVIASATYLPFDAWDTRGFRDRTRDLAWGGGVRIGVLRESFTVPGISVSGMYRRLGNVGFGNVCDAGIAAETTEPADGYTFHRGECVGSGDFGQFSFGLSNWSARAAISKRLLAIGAVAGIGYDEYRSDLAYGFRGASPAGVATPTFRATGLELNSQTLSGFVNGVFALPFIAFVVEGGYMQGVDAIRNFDDLNGEFDPAQGTLFGSVGVRLSL